MAVISPVFSCFFAERETRRTRPHHAVAQQKNPARHPARAFRRSFGEYAFLEDSRYTSQAENGFLEAWPKTQYPQGAAATPP
jgi:hypothetical protein